MRCFLWLLLLPGHLVDPSAIIPETLSAWEGSCVFISCSIERTFKSRPINQVSFAWYFEASYDDTLKDYTGKLLYNSNQTVTAVSSEFSNRVKFVGNLNSKNCSLKISQLRQTDTGKYGIRVYGVPGSLREQYKWMGEVAVTVRESPSELITTSSPEMYENSENTVRCSIHYSCFDKPITLSIQGIEDHRVLFPKMTTGIQTVHTELSFHSSWKDHKKQLTCLLKTHDGRKMGEKPFASLEVKYAPKGVKVNADPGNTMQEGNKLTLECIVDSSNPDGISYQWFKNDISWIYGRSRTDFYSLKETDAGNYRCSADNGIGSMSSESLMINVQYPPKVNIIMPQLPIREKDNVVLKCSATGNPPIRSYEWYKSSTPGIIMIAKELRLEAIQPRNSDTYHCVVRNDIGQSNSSVTLNVHYCPKDVQLFHLNHLPIKEGDKVILNCSVGSSYPRENRYTFFLSDGKTFESRTSALTFFAVPALLTYSCKACNSVGCTSSSTITLDVLFGPKDVRLSRKPLGLVLKGNSVQLCCTVRMANPKNLSYTWYKNEQLLPLNSTENSLFIQNASSVDSGSYRCVSKNIVTNAGSPTLSLNVNYGPRDVHLTVDRKAITEGMDVTLKCDNDAYPSTVTYKWYWKGEEILMEKSKFLVLSKVKAEQSGEYLCKAFNSISSKESQLITISVSYSRATVMKQTLIGLGVFLAFIMLLGLLIHGLKKWKKTRPDTGSAQRSGSFFLKKAKREAPPNTNHRPNEGRRDSPLNHQNEEQDGTISYARLQFSHNELKDHTIYSRVMQPNVQLDSSENSVIYSVVTKPVFHPKNDTKVDYENVVSNKEEELHYSSLVNLAPRSHPSNVDLESDSESEESIQYATLKH